MRRGASGARLSGGRVQHLDSGSGSQSFHRVEFAATPLQAPLSSVPSCRARIRRLHPSVRQFVGGRAGGKDMPGAGRQKGEAGAWWRSRKIVL
ncbi:uncharacterized protein [Equus przewalskii]|uniref:Uncharacterized protein isoform X11 n=1 Tax=Equus przewalskii TaxID=9798 RepID=A0ABM4P9N5_EQUPR